MKQGEQKAPIAAMAIEALGRNTNSTGKIPNGGGFFHALNSADSAVQTKFRRLNSAD